MPGRIGVVQVHVNCPVAAHLEYKRFEIYRVSFEKLPNFDEQVDNGALSINRY